ncbi:DsbA family protein [Psychromonas sp. MB-3u-54]|uniref:DsbA family protein n=1 Tax=Psychromonas sp. MB-3u-54 TaxID=2058319 RepID=UPI000C324133|nr:DsbA family protein [Psychromonas sp. MB-3u-54]PKH04479.1 DsbA family protein [Psychromonas sp. MB-3u-54]
MTSSKSCFYYVHDPMCSWCWAHLPEWQKLEAHLSRLLPVQYVLGGLAPDSDLPMPSEQQQAIRGYWQKINHFLGTEFNYNFWSENIPRRSTYPACRAVLAASWQNAEHDMNIALQKAYYLRAMNPSNIDTHLFLAKELGLNIKQFSEDLSSEKLENEFKQQLALAGRLPIQGFPSMVLSHQGNLHPIALDYQDHRGALAQVKKILAS